MGAEMLSEAKAYITAQDGSQWSNLAEGLVCLHVSHSNLSRRMIEIRFDKHMSIGDLKLKLHRHTGTPAFSQRLVLKDGGQAIANMDDDSKKLGYYSPDNGMEIHIIDTDPFSMSRAGGLEDESQIAKYRMSEEEYEKRQGTVRSWIKEQKAKDPNWQPPKPNMMNGNPWVKAPPEADIGHGPESVAGKEVGMRCEVSPGARRGVVMWVGEDPKLPGEGFWMGIKFDEPVGKGDGTAKGERFFECEERFGGWCRGWKVEVGDFPEADFDLEDSDDEDEI